MSFINLGRAVSAARAVSSSRKLTLKVSQAQEVLACLFGYGTYAALNMDSLMTSDEEGLAVADHIVLNPNRAIVRCHKLGLPAEMMECCAMGARETIARPLYLGVEEFWETAGRSDVISHVYEDPYFSAQMAESSHIEYDPAGFELDMQSGRLWKAQDVWMVETSGEMQGELNDEDDDGFPAGDTIEVWGRATYRKSGRAGLILDHLELSPMPHRR